MKLDIFYESLGNEWIGLLPNNNEKGSGQIFWLREMESFGAFHFAVPIIFSADYFHRISLQKPARHFILKDNTAIMAGTAD